ncbi:MAG: hypothetical protein V3V75_08720 [Thermoguttaceae bacterium]
MSTAPENDWRAQALRNMEQAEPEQLTPPKTGTSLTMVFAKLALLMVLAVPLVCLGYSFLFALILVGWYLFWPR